MWSLISATALLGGLRKAAFGKIPNAVDAYDYVDVAAPVESPDVSYPLSDAALGGFFARWTETSAARSMGSMKRPAFTSVGACFSDGKPLRL
jgi:hypothetical protein